MASTSYDYTVNVWDPNTWTLIQRYSGHTNPIFGLDQIDDDTMASASWDGTIRIWKIRSGKMVRTINVSESVNPVRVLSVGFQIACGLPGGRSDSIRIYNYDTGDLVKSLNGHASYVNAIEILNEKYIASGSWDSKVIIWDLSTFSIKYNLAAHTVGVYCIKRISNNLLASADGSGKINIWNWLNGTLVFKLTGHTGKIWYCSLELYDEQTLISGSFDKTIKFWNITSGKYMQTLNTDIQISALAVSKAGRISF